MSFADIAIPLILVAGSAFFWIIVGRAATAVTALVFGFFVVPRDVFAFGEPVPYFGVAGAVPSVSTYLIAIAVALVCLGYAKRSFELLLVVGIAGSFLLATGTVWQGTAVQWSGSIHYSASVIAFLVGLGLYKADHLSLLLKLLIGAFAFHIGLQIAQVFVPGVFAGATAFGYLAESRTFGAFNHPSVLGKVALLALPIVLPATLSPSASTRRLANFCVALMFISTAATLSRANIAGLLAALAIWGVVVPGRASIGRRLALPVITVLAFLPFAGLLAERFSQDPAGGQRAQLLETGLTFIRSNWLLGTGPNSYVDAIGQVDALTARGFPVHNVFLLLIAELGIIFALLVMLPLVVVYLRACQVALKKTAPFAAQIHARAALACLPGILLIAVTGWGLAAGSLLALWFISVGYTWLAMRPPVAAPTSPKVARRSAVVSAGSRDLASRPLCGARSAR